MLDRKREIAKKSLMDSCNTCKGLGCRECAASVERINVLAKANIPAAYWNYSLSTFNGNPIFKAQIEELVQNIESMYNSGKSIVFTGPHGIGKTFGGIEILKAAMAQKMDVFYTTMNEVIDSVLSKEGRYGFKQMMISSAYLMLDEVDSRFVPTSDLGKDVFGANIENIIRCRLQNNLPMIICSNNSSLLNVFDGSFKQTFNSLFSSRSFTYIPVGGVDLRKIKG
jgi:DNA replication protein DnaC